MVRGLRSALISLGTMLALAYASPAAADGSTNDAAAEALFDEGVALVDAGKIADGCKKLEASEALDAGTGTLLHLADCYERAGRTATAWARFREAAARAARDRRVDWETIAKTRANELEPKLGKLRIDAPPGVSVQEDGADIPNAALGSELPTDPGPHTLRATAKGKKPWTRSVTVEAGTTLAIGVPPLVDAPGDNQLAKSNNDSIFPWKTVGYAVGGVGIVGLAVGAVSGVSAISQNNKAKNVCPDSGSCADNDAREDASSARTAATLSTVGFVAGGALLAGGVLLVVLAPPQGSSTLSARLHVGPESLLIEGTF